MLGESFCILYTVIGFRIQSSLNIFTPLKLFRLAYKLLSYNNLFRPLI